MRLFELLTNPDAFFRRHNAKWQTAWLAVLLALAVGAIGYRVYSKYQTPGPFDSERQGFCDFHNGIYFPALAYRDGVSPYGKAYHDLHPVARPIPFFAPLVMPLHWPYTIVALPTADIIHFVLLLAQIAVLAWLAVRFAKLPLVGSTVLGVCLFIVVSRGGYATLFTGYFTLLLAIGTVVTLQFGHRPWLAGPAMLLACLKPTYAIPLVIVLCARRQWKTALVGTALVVVLNAAAVVWLLQSNSMEQLRSDVELAQSMHLEDPNEMPVNTWTRIDIMAIVAKWLHWNPSELVYLAAMLPLLVLPCAALWKLSGREACPSSSDLSGLIAGLAILVTVYHHYYDALLLIPAILGLWANQAASVRAMSVLIRWLILVILVGVQMNYFSAQFVMQRLIPESLSPIVTSVNAVALVVALLLAVCEAFRVARSLPTEAAILKGN